MDKKMSELKSLSDFEKLAVNESMNDTAKVYFSACAFSAAIPRDNEDAFKSYRIRPRVLRDVSEAKLDSEILNCSLPCPIGLSPTAHHFLANKDAEIATARGCVKEDCIFIMSCVSSCLLEDVSSSLSDINGVKPTLWFQIYIFKDREVSLNLIKRAENAGFSAIVVTADSPAIGIWRKFFSENFDKTIKPCVANLPCLPGNMLDPTLTFDDLKWLKENTKLPIVVKGILTGEDAAEAARCGVSAILVSNHGERQIYRTIPTIDALEDIVQAVEGTGVDVFLDGGIRTASDIFVALALGAKAVFLGRPAVWGLAVKGEEGVRRVLQILKEDFLKTMQLAGASRIQDIKRCMVRKM